jgi:hypothetical protein
MSVTLILQQLAKPILLAVHAPFANACLALQMQPWLASGAAGAGAGAAAAPSSPETSFLGMVSALYSKGKLFSGVWHDYMRLNWVQTPLKRLLAPAAELLRDSVGGVAGLSLAYGYTDVLPQVVAYPFLVSKLRAFFPGNLPRLSSFVNDPKELLLDGNAVAGLWAGCGLSLVMAPVHRFLFNFVWNLLGSTSRGPWYQSGVMVTATSLASLAAYPVGTLSRRLALAPDLSYADAVGRGGIKGLFEGVGSYLAMGVFTCLPSIALIFLTKKKNNENNKN